MKVSSILIVEDESILAQDISQMLTGFGYSVLGIESTGRDAINRLDTVQPDLILMDIHLRGEMDGIDTARAIRESHDIPVVYLTAYADQDTLERAKITEPFGYILKPFDNRELHTVIEMGLYKHRMERNLRDSEVQYRTLFEQATDAIFVADSAGSYIDVSPSACKMVGYSRAELLEFSIDTLIPNEDSQSDPLQLTDLKTGKEVFGERRFRCKDKRILTVEVSAKMLNDGRIQMLARDITKRKELEEEKIHLERQLLHFQKLETIGTLAGGIAHDFNNILTPIMGYADMALSNLPSGTALRDDLKHIVKGAHRARALVEQILLFSKNIEKERKPLGLHSIVKEGLKLLRPSIPTTIEIRQRIDSHCAKVLADAAQMHQVIVNLCTNAWQAMEEKGGTLTIELKQVEVDAATAKSHPNLKEGQWVRLTVSDTGTGMDDATLERIFEPFFTTKAVDKGTGMGLSVIHGIVASHHGHILVDSEQGKGSSFYVYLPIASAGKEISKKELGVIQGGEESILVVDDEEVVANVVLRMLERLGYKVDVYNSSIEALKAIRQKPEKYHLVVSDLTMPKMTGLALSEQLQKIRPEFPTLIMTGYGESLPGDILTHYGVHEVIGKPIKIRELADSIRKVLDK